MISFYYLGKNLDRLTLFGVQYSENGSADLYYFKCVTYIHENLVEYLGGNKGILCLDLNDNAIFSPVI